MDSTAGDFEKDETMTETPKPLTLYTEIETPSAKVMAKSESESDNGRQQHTEPPPSGLVDGSDLRRHGVALDIFDSGPKTITLDDVDNEKSKNVLTDESSQVAARDHTLHMNSIDCRPSESPNLPTRYLNSQYQSNSYFSRRLLRLSQLIVVGDLIALGCFYFYDQNTMDDNKLYIGSPLKVLVWSEHASCSTSVALAALVYHLFPAVLILGLPASGFRIFEPFRREQRIDRGGRRQKVKRTVCLQICELVGAGIFLYEAFILGFFIYYVASGKIFVDCDSNVPAYLFCIGAIVMFWLLFVLMRAFARFREHLKMQLGAFKESDQTGDVKAHMLRSKLKRKKRQQEKNGHQHVAPTRFNPPRSAIIKDIRKRLFRGAQLGDLRLLRRSIHFAKLHLGESFARELYPDPVMVCGIFGLAKKNPMHVAAYQGNLAALELLYTAHFKVNAFDKVSRVRFSTGDLFWYLASYFIPKPVVSADETYSSVFKTTLVTPLHCAVSTGRVGAVQWLIDHGADVNLCSKSSHRCESRLPPLFLADHPDIIHLLLRAGANHLAIPDPGHMNTITVLQLAYLRGNYAVAQVLEDWGGDVALTPLHAAAAMNDVATIRSLLRKKVPPDVLGELGYIGLNKRTPLHWAAVNGAVNAVEILLAAKANANFQDAHGRTALHWAARVNRVDIVRILVTHGADPTIVDHGDMTPLICAACAGGTSVDMFKTLVAAGADINHQLCTTGDTALHLAVKLDDQETALAILSLGGDIMRTNHDGFRPIDCTTSTKLQFEIKRAAGTRDVMVSYTHSHQEFALKLRQSLEANNITVWLDLMDPSGIGGGSVWREEIARGITNAAVVLCILTEDYTQSEWCLKELALAKQVGTPILAISTEHATISEELQVYLYTRQLVPFEKAITRIDKVNDKEIVYSYDDEAYKIQLRMLLDGMKDEIEKRKDENMKRNIRRAESNPMAGARQVSKTCRGNPATSGRNGSHALCGLDASTEPDRTNSSSYEHDEVMSADESVVQMVLPACRPSVRPYGHAVFAASQRHLRLGTHHSNGTTLSNVSSSSSSSSFLDDASGSDSLVLDPSGYYFHRTNSSRRTGRTTRKSKVHETTDSIVETLDDLTNATACGEQFVFLSHGDHHHRFVRKLCVELCREGGLRCYVDRKPVESEQQSSGNVRPEDLSVRIHQAKEAILKCSAFIVLLSDKTLTSELVKDQLAFAEDKGKKILPVVVNRMAFHLDIKYTLARSEFFHFLTKGDMMGFQQSLRHLLEAVREEVYGISIDSYLPSLSDGRVSSLNASYLSTRRSFRDSGLLSPRDSNLRKRRPISQSLIFAKSARPESCSFGLPSTRLSHTFAETSGGPATTRSVASDLSLCQSMIGTFSTLVGHIPDEILDEEEEEEEEDEEDDDRSLSYTGIEGKEEEEEEEDVKDGTALGP